MINENKEERGAIIRLIEKNARYWDNGWVRFGYA